MAVTAALALSASPTHASAVPDIRVIRSIPGRPLPRFVRLRFDVVDDGVAGTEDLLVDTATGRYADRTKLGPLSGVQGYDGMRTWSADATGLAENDEDPESRSAALEWSYLVAGSHGVAPRVARLPRGRDAAFRLRYPTLRRAVDVTLDGAGRVREAVLYGAFDDVHMRFAGYHREGDLVVPWSMASGSKRSASRARLRAVELPADIAPAAFARPPAPRDTSLDGVAAVPMKVAAYGPEVRIRIDGGPPLNVLVDTGASYALTPSAARRSGLRLVGRGFTNGIGAYDVPERYAMAHVVRIGGAELRDQPFEVFAMDEWAEPGLDGIIGYEVFARFAARFDFARGRLELARDAASLHPRGTRIAIRLYGGQPEAGGSFDGVRGPIAIDTGSTFGLDVMSPVVRAHRLMARYRPTQQEYSVGIGGGLITYAARAPALHLGALVVRDVPLSLDVAAGGAMADPYLAGNAGLRILRRFVMVLDYRGRAMYLDPVR